MHRTATTPLIGYTDKSKRIFGARDGSLRAMALSAAVLQIVGGSPAGLNDASTDRG
jgi:hypothetical protein